MKIGIITTNSFPIPYKTHGGDVVIIDLAHSLDEMGHEVHLYAPEFTKIPSHAKLFTMRASYGNAFPQSLECEQECFNNYFDILRDDDIVHDFSASKYIIETLYKEGKKNVISTIMGGAWNYPTLPHNLVVWSNAHRDRVMRGMTDYENTPTPTLDGSVTYPVKNAHVVHAGVDTDFYCPSDYKKNNYFLWMNRWYHTRGYRQAIEIARQTGIELIMAGENPDNELFDAHKHGSQEAMMLAADLPNVKFVWLPADPDHHIAKRELYRKARGFLNCVQTQEPFGLAQVEAMACGTPIIATNYGSMPEIIQSGVTGYICNNDIKSFAIGINDIDNINIKTCRDEAVKRFDRKIMAENYLKQYKLILNGNSW